MDYIKLLLELTPQQWAPVLGLLAAFGATQRLKFLLPAEWSPKAREVSAQSIAFATGWLATALVFGGRMGVIVGFVVGLAAPAVWNIGMLVLGWWKPTLAAILSQDVRTKP